MSSLPLVEQQIGRPIAQLAQDVPSQTLTSRNAAIQSSVRRLAFQLPKVWRFLLPGIRGISSQVALAVWQAIRIVKDICLAAITHIRSVPRCYWELNKAPDQGWALTCVAACTFAAVITVSPTAGDYWSRQTYPAVAAIDGQLESIGVSIGPPATPDAPVSRPMIAVVFGRILPDDEVEEQRVDFADEGRGYTPGRNWNDIIRPAHWSREVRSQRSLSEAYEINH